MKISRRARMGTLAGLAVAYGAIFAAPSQAVHQTVTGLTQANQIVQFAVGTPNTLTSGPTAITGTVGAEDLVGIDYRPRTGELFGVGAGGTVYTVVAATGAATPITQQPAVNPFTGATDFGVDFNPAVDRIRVVNDGTSGADDNNFRFRPDNGAIVDADTGTVGQQNDTDLSEGTIVAAAYDQNVDLTPTTTLFGLDSDEEELVRQGGVNGAPSPNGGLITEIGSLGAAAGDVTDVAGFDIETQTGVFYASTQTTGETVSRFFRLNAGTGAATAPVATNDTRIGGAAGPLVESVSLIPIPVINFANAVTSVSEGGTATVSLTRTGLLNQQATINYTTELTGSNTASASDFTPASGTLTFPPGVATQSFAVPTTQDTADESDETIGIRMSAPSVTVNLGTNPLLSTVNIVDNDDAAVADPVPGTGDIVGKPGVIPSGLISVPTQKIDKSIKATFACDEACAAALDLKLGKKMLDSASSTLGDSGSGQVSFDLSAGEVKQLKEKSEGKKSAKLNIAGTFSDGDGAGASKVKFQLG